MSEKKPGANAPSGQGGAPPAPAETAKTKPKTLQQRADAGEALTPAECAKLTGNVKKRRERVIREGDAVLQGTPPFTVKHLVAAHVHGWNEHRLHSADPFAIKLDDYEKAISVAGENKCHKAACSPVAMRARALRKQAVADRKAVRK